MVWSTSAAGQERRRPQPAEDDAVPHGAQIQVAQSISPLVSLVLASVTPLSWACRKHTEAPEEPTTKAKPSLPSAAACGSSNGLGQDLVGPEVDANNSSNSSKASAARKLKSLSHEMKSIQLASSTAAAGFGVCGAAVNNNNNNSSSSSSALAMATARSTGRS